MADTSDDSVISDSSDTDSGTPDAVVQAANVAASSVSDTQGQASTPAPNTLSDLINIFTSPITGTESAAAVTASHVVATSLPSKAAAVPTTTPTAQAGMSTIEKIGLVAGAGIALVIAAKLRNKFIRH